MRILLFTTIFLFHFLFSFSQDISGAWKGNLEANGKLIPLVFHLNKNSSGQWEGKWDSPSQRAKNLPCNDIVRNGDSLIIGLKIISGYYNGKLIGVDSITGMWHQGNGSSALNLKKSTDSIFDAPTYPNEKEVSITSIGGSKIYGTLLSKNNHQKLAIIIAGSGPTDRDGNNLLGVEANSYKMLAHALDSLDIATFRFDKRGIAASISPDFKEEDIVFDDYVKDAEKIFDYLHDSIGFNAIYFLGHSEGSLIGILASQKKKAKGFVSIAGAGRPIDEVLKEQIGQQPLPDSLKTQAASILDQLKKGDQVKNIPPYLNSLFRNSIQPYMISWLKYSPVTEIKKLSCPVLILQGSCDLQTKVEDAENLHNANKKNMLDVIPLMTHTLKNAEAGCKDENNKTYADGSLPLNRKLISDVENFIKK